MNKKLIEWIQEKSAHKELEYGKVSGQESPTDFFTKGVNAETPTQWNGSQYQKQ